MKAPSAPAYRGLWAALNVANATPVGGDFTEANMRDIDEAIAWLQREAPHSLYAKTGVRLSRKLTVRQ